MYMTDNGWIQFNHVTIPRENMLAKWSQVEPDVSKCNEKKSEKILLYNTAKGKERGEGNVVTHKVTKYM